MKTKNKIVALLEIAVVLCSVLLVAIPAVAAQEQNQELQKVSANTITTASEDDYVLDIYGNANEDDTIDMGDVVYTKLAIFGKKSKTELCDAKYDGRINVLDVIQTKLIILGKEKEITVNDFADRIVTVNKPIKRVFVISGGREDGLEAIRVFGIPDKVVGISIRKGLEAYFPELSKLPQVDLKDYEGMLSLNPDLVITAYPSVSVEAAKKLPGVTVVCVSVGYKPEISKGMTTLGYICDKEDEAKHYLNDFVDKRFDLIKARTEGLSEEKRSKVYEAAYGGPYRVYPQELVEAAGGRDIFAGLPIGSSVDPEAVIAKNPDIIIKKMKQTDSGYDFDVDDVSKAKAIRDEIMSRPELANVNAVKNGRVYVIYGLMCYGLQQPIPIAYYAKWFYPEIFEDFNPKAIHQEYLTEFQHLDFNVYEHGVFVYPPLED